MHSDYLCKQLNDHPETVEEGGYELEWIQLEAREYGLHDPLELIIILEEFLGVPILLVEQLSYGLVRSLADGTLHSSEAFVEHLNDSEAYVE
jgi:hypothetical protein